MITDPSIYDVPTARERNEADTQQYVDDLREAAIDGAAHLSAAVSFFEKEGLADKYPIVMSDMRNSILRIRYALGAVK